VQSFIEIDPKLRP